MATNDITFMKVVLEIGSEHDIKVDEFSGQILGNSIFLWSMFFFLTWDMDIDLFLQKQKEFLKRFLYFLRYLTFSY